jgi:hypothetical protein
LYSFFDNVDEEIDLSTDPIYQQLEFQRKYPHQPLPEHLQVKKIQIPTLLPSNLWQPTKLKSSLSSSDTAKMDVESGTRQTANDADDNTFEFATYTYKIYQLCLQSLSKHYQTFLASTSSVTTDSSSTSILQNILVYSVALLKLLFFSCRAILSFILRLLYAILRGIFYEGLWALMQQRQLRNDAIQRNEDWNSIVEVTT